MLRDRLKVHRKGTPPLVPHFLTAKGQNVESFQSSLRRNDQTLPDGELPVTMVAEN